MQLKTITLYKAEGRIIINAKDKDTYLADGYLPTKKEALAQMKQETTEAQPSADVVEAPTEGGEEDEHTL